MKKKREWKGFILGFIAATLVFNLTMPALAATVKQITATYKNVQVVIDGKRVTPKDAQGRAIEPFISDGTTYLPIRGIASALGLDVEWDGKTNTVYLTSDQQEPVETPKPTEKPTPAPVDKDEYAIGDTWTVPGKWTLTITGVQEMSERNPYSDKNPAAVYLVDYTYTNLGYKSDILDGLFITIYDTIVDSKGVMGYTYPNSVTRHPDATPIGATCHAQEVIAVDNPGTFKLTVTEYDEDYNRHQAVFRVAVK